MAKKSVPEGKLALFWMLGALSLVFAAWIIGHTQTFKPILFIAFLLILFAGLCWIGVGVSMARGR